MILQADPIEVERGGRLALSAPGFEVGAGQAGAVLVLNGAGQIGDTRGEVAAGDAHHSGWISH